MKKRPLPSEPPKAKTLEEAQHLIDELWLRLVEEDRKANRNSKNSSQPPSSNGPGQASGKSIPKPPKDNGKKHLKRGGQSGHKGHRRELLPVSKADAVHQHYCATHCGCGGAVIPHRKACYRHQIFDLPEVIAYRMEEHQLFHGDCDRCGQRHKAHLPDNISPTQMGPNLLSFVGALAGHYHLSLSLTRELVRDLFGLSFSIGAYSQAQGQLSPMLTLNHQLLHEAVSREAIQFADETRHQRDGEKRWMWLLTSQNFAYFMTHHDRTKKAAKKLLDKRNRNPLSVLVMDHYAAYTAVVDSSIHQ